MSERINPLDHPICLAQPLRLDNISAWVEHIPFGMFVIDILHPKVFVELGTHTGISYSAFCQAVKQLGLDTHCYAIDTWEGDVHAGFYGAEILADLRAHHDFFYGDFSSLVQSTFDEAVKHFSDGSIDLLHIDGLHTYEAVKRDFETWLPKLSQRAIVLFHDTNVRERGFGVWEFWAELQQKYPHFEFFHGHGLGVLWVGGESIPAVEPLFSASDAEIKQIREFFFTLGFRFSAEQFIQALSTQVAEKEQSVQALSAQVAEKEQAIRVLSVQVAKEKQSTQRVQVQLDEISNGKAWKIILLLRRVSVTLAPPNSLRARMLQSFVNITYALLKKTKRNQKRDEELALIRMSGLFDEAWYLANNPDVAQTKTNPLLHYLRYGGFKDRDPGPNFSSKWYLNKYEDVRKAGINPLVHYLKNGKATGRKPKPDSDPIIVHQMGKVGSKTVELSLQEAYKNLGIQIPIYHTHSLNDFERRRQTATEEQGQRNPQSTLSALQYGENVRKQIDENPSQHWNIISLVRDPIARNIASFFHNLPEYIPDWRERYVDGKLSTNEIQALFLSVDSKDDVVDYWFNYWFDLQVKSIPAIGIDVYETTFPHKIGYKIYPGAFQVSLLVIRQENLNECAERAMHEFLGLENFALHNTNLADEKDYADLYRAFKEMPLPVEYVEKIYKTRFARHFYTDSELELFTQRWTKNVKIENSLLPSATQKARKDAVLLQNPDEDVALVRSSGLFNEAWYLTNNPDVAQAKVDPLRHYLHHGGFEGRDPGPNFSSKWYLDTYQDVKNAGLNPLIHYLKYGRENGRLAQSQNIEFANSPYTCPICRKKVNQFLPLPTFYAENLQKYGWPYTFDDAETMNAEQYNCPHCKESDRNRLYAIYLKERISKYSQGDQFFLLDIAPSQPLSKFINQFKNVIHHTADLLVGGVDFAIDITNMPEIASDSYDILICSHVLEHVQDDKKALSELYRVLKPGGWGIIMVPIILAIDQIDEDPAVIDIAERWRRFGQDDHVRLYSKPGFIQRVKAAGFTLKQLGIEHFGKSAFQEYGITAKSVLYIAEKPLSAAQK